MKKLIHPIATLFIAAIGLTSCSEDVDPDPCASRNIALTATITPAHEGQSDGKIVVSASGSSGFSYSINGGDFQASATFDGLAAGNYTIAARDKDDCTASQQFTVQENGSSAVSYASQIRPIIENVCWNCHKESGQAGFAAVDLSTDAKVKENAVSINTEVQAGRMPKNGTLSADQKAAIQAWVDAGAPIDN